MSACAAAATRRKTTRICFHRTASSERLSMDLFFFCRQGIARSVGRARVSKRRKSQYNTHIIYWHIGVSRLRRWLKRVPFFFLSLARRVDGWMASRVFSSPTRSAYLARRRGSNGSSHRWPGWKMGDFLGRFRWLVDLVGCYIGQALRVSFFFRRDGWMDLGMDLGTGGGGYKCAIVLCVRW